MENVIGRTEEKALIKRIENSGEPELLAVYGRRRIGKTYLIRNGFSQGLAFEFSGTHNATLNQELESFSLALTNASGGIQLAKPASWIQAFQMLIQYLTPLIKKERKIIFLMNFPGSIRHDLASYQHLKTSGIVGLLNKRILWL